MKIYPSNTNPSRPATHGNVVSTAVLTSAVKNVINKEVMSHGMSNLHNLGRKLRLIVSTGNFSEIL